MPPSDLDRAWIRRTNRSFEVITWLIATAGVGIGLAAGLLGAGASIFTVLLFLHVAGLDLAHSVVTSLATVALTSLVGLVPYAREKAVLWKAGFGFGLASMTGAYLGGHLSASIPDPVLMVLFAATMAIAAIAMFSQRSSLQDQHPTVHRHRMATVAAAGLIVGALTGTIGLGGGFAVVPLLVVGLGVPMRRAVGTSLFVIAMNTLAALAGHLPQLEVDWPLAALVGSTSSAGSLAGAWLAKRVQAETLRRAFAILMLAGAGAQLASSIVR